MEDPGKYYMLPIGGFFVCVFVGWTWDRATVEAEASLGSPGFKAMNLWVNLLRWVGPLVIGEVRELERIALTDSRPLPGEDQFKELVIADDDDGGVGRNSRIVADLSPGEYFVQIRHYNTSGGSGDYVIKVSK